MDASRCIAYFNIELNGPIPKEFRAAIGSNVVGCDICQDVCPWNGSRQETEVRRQKTEDGSRKSEGETIYFAGGRSVATTVMPEFQPMHVSIGSEFEETESRIPPEGGSPSVAVSKNPEHSEFSLFNPSIESLASLSEDDFRRIFRKSPIKRVKYWGWLRNLCVVMGNSGESKFLPRLRYFREHADPVVREHAEWAIQQIMRVNHLPAAKDASQFACPS